MTFLTDIVYCIHHIRIKSTIITRKFYFRIAMQTVRYWWGWGRYMGMRWGWEWREGARDGDEGSGDGDNVHPSVTR